MIHLSLFSGIGGIDLAAEWAGFRTVAVCEIDPHCRRVLSRHFPDAHQFEDVRDVDRESLRRAGIGRPTLVSAGFPCQPHSVAGRRRADRDERHLWPEVARVLREARPRWFLGENVRGLLSSADGRVFGDVLRDLADLGYGVGWGCYGADEAAGAPHRRDRVFIVGYLADRDDERREIERRLQPGMGARGHAHRRGEDLGDAERSWRREDQEGRREKGRTALRGSGGGGVFPPGRGDDAGWRRVLAVRPDLAPALYPEEEAQLQVRPVTDGVSRRVALRMLGNAVVPQQVYPVLAAIARMEASR